MKKLLLLGGSRYLKPVIETAHNLGIYVITCDYLPDNDAHKYSDEYRNISIIDKDAVLEAAKEMKIDGIMSFACDPGVTTAAYVAEQLGLPYAADYKTVCIMQDKGLFRQFLSKHGFNTPIAQCFTDAYSALSSIEQFNMPVIVKPVDSAGSKGVTKVDNPSLLKGAVNTALDCSISGKCIIEEFIESDGDPTDCDCFSVKGEMKCINFSGQKFDVASANPFTPAGFIFPSSMTNANKRRIADELKRLCKLLGLRTSLYNVEARIGKNGKAYLMEVSPRGGGNRLAEMIRYSTGTDLIDAAVRAALDMDINSLDSHGYDSFWYEHILHSNTEGIFQGITIDNNIQQYLTETDIWINEGEAVTTFSGANKTIGTLVFHFPTKDILNSVVDNIGKMISISVC